MSDHRVDLGPEWAQMGEGVSPERKDVVFASSDQRDRYMQYAIKKALRGHVGRERALSKEKLRSRVMQEMPRGLKNIHEREIRKAIEVLRNEDSIGALICSSAGVRGYWMAEDLDDVLEGYRQERKRAITLLVTMRQRLKFAREFFGGQRKLL